MENEVIVVAGGAIKLFIDMISGIIPEEKRKYIPLLAWVFGLAWAVFLVWGDLSETIPLGVAIGAAAIWVNEAINMGKKKD